ncbi:MAG TPA: COX15/CtaA family protein [Gammaproteobacteria bacterium]|nr:COX15/CtaA family protein [Gammaproteobacteria bacterium]
MVCIALILALVVVVLGAYVRLSDAGLGCPDWPGCYGNMTRWPATKAEVERANRAFPQRPVVASKAIKEMVHRYFAGSLGLLILALAVTAVRARRRPQQPVALPLALLFLVIFQALLGMWTVTLQLKPVIVMGHLVGGFATLSLLWWLFLSGSTWANRSRINALTRYRTFAFVGTIILICQIALGGWTSANYAAAACPDFPTCQSQWWPHMNFSEAFVLWRGLGLNYEFGVLDNPARMAVHVTYRLGALVTAVYLVALSSILFFKTRGRAVRTTSVAVLVLTLLQILIGISNVILGFPLALAAAHTAAAALLLLSMLTLDFVLVRAAEPTAQEVSRAAAMYTETKDVFS